MRPIATDHARNVVCVLVTRVWNCQDSIWRGGDVWLTWAQGTMWIEIPPREGGNFEGCPARWKALGVSAAVYAARGIIQSSITAW